MEKQTTLPMAPDAKRSDSEKASSRASGPNTDSSPRQVNAEDRTHYLMMFRYYLYSSFPEWFKMSREVQREEDRFACRFHAWQSLFLATEFLKKAGILKFEPRGVFHHVKH